MVLRSTLTHAASPALDAAPARPEALSKESHFFGGLLGHGSASSAALYRSCFPTIITRWVGRGTPCLLPRLLLGLGSWDAHDHWGVKRSFMAPSCAL